MNAISKLAEYQATGANMRCMWCPRCQRIALFNAGRKPTIISEGSENCRQTIRSGTIAECLSDLKLRS